MSDKNPCILFCSLSAKTALYREVNANVQLFSKKAKVIACDCDINCHAASEVEHFIVLPRLNELTDEALLKICHDNQITHILPTRDSELLFWAERKEMLKRHDIIAWVSDPSFIRHCDDKLIFSKVWHDSEMKIIPAFESPLNPKINRWVAKARSGSGSRKVWLNLSKEDINKLPNRISENLIFQPFIEGKEFTAEMWISQSRQCRGPLLRWRNKIVNGESHLTTIFQNKQWESLLRSVFLHQPGALGHCLAQVIVDQDCKLHLIEINPRLGGASPLALHAGLNSIAWHLMEESGQINEIPQKPNFPAGMYLKKQNGSVSFNY